MKEKLIRGKYFYGWYIVAAGFLIMATAWGMVFNCSSLFIKPISEDLGLTRSQMNLTMTIRAGFQMLILLLSGKIFTKFDIKKTMKIGTIALFVSFFATSFVSSLTSLYIFTAFSAISVSLITISPLSIIINNWFVEKRGLAIGIAFMGSGVGGMILGSLVGLWIVSYGWRISYQILATIMLVCVLPCVFFIIHIRPKDLGLEPLGGYSQGSISGLGEDGVMLEEATKTIGFWGIILCSVLVALGLNGLMTTISPHLTDIGYSTTFSANIVALSMGALAVGKLVLGRMYDVLGVSMATTASCLAILFGLIGLIFAGHPLALLVIILGTGLGSSYGTIAHPIITSSIFGLKDYAAIYGVLQSSGSIGGMIGPIIIGYMYDSSGSYLSSYILMSIITLLAIIIYQFVFMKYKVVEA